MTRPHGHEDAENPLTSSRAVRLALTKAANDTVGVILTVASVAEEITDLDDMLGMLGDGLMLVGLERGNALVGMIALDMELRAAVLEQQTMGSVLAHRADERAPTRTDKMLCEPLISTFLSAFPQAVLGTALEGWGTDVALGESVESPRAAGLVLEDCAYRIVRLSVDLGVAERQAELIIVLPVVQEEKSIAAPAPSIADGDWDTIFEENVALAPARLDAVLHRFPVSLATAQSLQIGTVLPLPGCTVHSVRLLAPDGAEVAQAKLGQLGGYRAVRIETAPAPQLAELPAATPGTPMPMPDTIGLEVEEAGPDLADDLPLSLDESANPLDLGLMTDQLPPLGDIPFDPDAL